MIVIVVMRRKDKRLVVHAPEAVARPLLLQRGVIYPAARPQPRVVVGVGIDHRDALPVPIHAAAAAAAFAAAPLLS